MLQLEGFGSAGLLTAAEEKKLGRQLQALIVLEARREEATARLGRQISSAEWMAECSMTDAKVFKRTIKVGILSACTQSMPKLAMPPCCCNLCQLDWQNEMHAA